MKIEMKSPAQRESEVLKGLTDEKRFVVMTKVSFDAIKNWWKKWRKK